ncbi:UNVERIFIED_CONTAM: hypothetical protein H355_012169 [Colinus virginianus]|nr:hypothetical protein H355_012169 [Colinus virginianus]
MAGTEQPLRQPSEADGKALTAVALSSPACVLCGRVDEDSDILGQKNEIDGSYFHTYCVLFANGLCQEEDDGNFSFSKDDAIRTIEQAEQTHCIVCGKTGASITCAETGCDRSFHLPCASKGECVTQYFNEYRSFCWEHRPQQAVEAVPLQDTTCIICMDPVGDSISYGTMVCPCCQHAWFHRACVQEQALCAGIYCFRCPLCRNRDSFIPEILILGIRTPVRRPRWENNNAYASLLERHGRCDASECHYPRGREQAERAGTPCPGTAEQMPNSSSISEFLLLALADMRQLQLLHFWLFLGIYLAALLGNGLISTAVACNQHLHTPMYFFLLNLALLDLGCISTTLPKAMANALWDTTAISYAGFMAYDRFVAICNPLRYGTLLGSRALLSYVQIFRAVLRMPSEHGQHKAFSTCLPHLAVVSLFVSALLFAYLKPPSISSPSLDLVVAAVYSVVPPAVNPLIYSMRNQELRDAMRKLRIIPSNVRKY